MLRSLGVAALLAAAAVLPAGAQFPGSVSGVVVDAATGAPVPAALVEVAAAGRAVRTDASGAFFLRGLEAGSHRVTARRAGYAPGGAEVRVRDGATARLTLALYAAAVAVEAVQVQAHAGRTPGETRIGRESIAASGARNLAEVLERTGAVLVTATGPTGERRASIRGSAADAVLVLVDGAALNDPVTGEADLSQLPAAAIQQVTVLSGARSSRYGPRAEAGVILVETRAPEHTRAASLALGSFGERAAAGEWGSGDGSSGLGAGLHGRTLNGRFDYREPFTGAEATRHNGDLRETGQLRRFGERYVAAQGMQLGRDGRVAVRIAEDGIRIGGACVTCVDGTLRI